MSVTTRECQPGDGTERLPRKRHMNKETCGLDRKFTEPLRADAALRGNFLSLKSPSPENVHTDFISPSTPSVHLQHTSHVAAFSPRRCPAAYSPGRRSRRSFACRSLTTNSVSGVSAITSTKVLRS